jgi:hypothetical protein
MSISCLPTHCNDSNYKQNVHTKYSLVGEAAHTSDLQTVVSCLSCQVGFMATHVRRHLHYRTQTVPL